MFSGFTSWMSFLIQNDTLTFIVALMFEIGNVLRLCVCCPGSNRYLRSRSTSGLDSEPENINKKLHADAEELRDTPQIQKIAHEKACNGKTTFKDTVLEVVAVRKVVYHLL